MGGGRVIPRPRLDLNTSPQTRGKFRATPVIFTKKNKPCALEHPVSNPARLWTSDCREEFPQNVRTKERRNGQRTNSEESNNKP